MEENSPQIDKVEVINKDAILQIKFKPDFYERLILVFKSTFDGKTEEEIIKAGQQIEANKVEEEWVVNYETMIYLIRAIEDYAKANNLTTMVDINEYLKDNNLQ